MNIVLLVTTAQAFVQQMLIDLLVLEGKTRHNSSDWASARMSSHCGGDKALVSIARHCLSCRERNARLHVREHSTASLPGMCVAAREQTLLSHFPL